MQAPETSRSRAGPPDTWAIVVAAGQGQRFGGAKQFADLGGRSVLDWAVAAVRAVAGGVVVVVPAEVLEDAGLLARLPVVEAVVAGALTRSGSVRAGLAAVPASAEVVVVHDAARPLATAALCRAAVAALADGDAGVAAAVAAVPVVDTVKRVVDGVVVATLDRTELVAVQTPQAFRAAWLRRAHEGEPEASDDAALVERAGGRVRIVLGEEANAKLTHAGDLERARRWAAGDR